MLYEGIPRPKPGTHHTVITMLLTTFPLCTLRPRDCVYHWQFGLLDFKDENEKRCHFSKALSLRSVLTAQPRGEPERCSHSLVRGPAPAT